MIFTGFATAMMFLLLGRTTSVMPGAWWLASSLATLVTVYTLVVVRRAVNLGTCRLILMTLVILCIMGGFIHNGVNLYCLYIASMFLGTCLRALVHVCRLIVLADKPLEPGVPYVAPDLL